MPCDVFPLRMHSKSFEHEQNIPASQKNVPNIRNAHRTQSECFECSSIIKECTTNFYSDVILANSDTSVTGVLASLYGCVLVTTSIAKPLKALAETRGTDTWLDSTDINKTLVRICLYFSKCTKFGQLIIRRIIKIVATKAKMHPILFRMGSAPVSAEGAHSAPQPPSWI